MCWPQYESSFINKEIVFVSACWTCDMRKIVLGEVFTLLNKLLSAQKRKAPVFLGSAILNLVALVNSKQYLLSYPDVKLVRKSVCTILYGQKTK